MANVKHAAVVVTLPDEIDVNNSDCVYEQICGAITPGISMVVADLRLTTFCDSSGARAITHARKHAEQAGVRLEFVIPPGGPLRVLEVMGLDKVLQPHATIAAALGSEYLDASGVEVRLCDWRQGPPTD